MSKYNKLCQNFFVLLILTGLVVIYSYFNKISIYQNRIKIISKQNLLVTKLPNIKIENLISGTIIFDQSHIKIYGYCNNVYSLLSAFTIALLEQRQLQVFWPQITKYIREPFPNTFVTNATINQLRNSSNYSIYNPPVRYAWKRNKTMADILNYRPDFPRDKKILVYSNYVAYFFEICARPIYYDRLFTMGLVEKETIGKARQMIKAINVTKNVQVIDVTYQIGKFLFKSTI